MTNYENLQTVVGDLLSADAKCGLKPNMDRKLLREQHDAIAALRDHVAQVVAMLAVAEAEREALREQVAALQLVVRDDAKWAQENEFLHKRRGELVIERDRYKAALGEYPEGRDVILAGTLAALEKAEADNAATEVMPTAAVRRYSLLRLRFFRDLTGAQRLSVLVKLKVLPPEWRQALTHAIETQILDSLQNTGRLDELEAAFADALERGND